MVEVVLFINDGDSNGVGNKHNSSTKKNSPKTRAEICAKWYSLNKEKALDSQAKWRAKNPEYSREWEKRNKEKRAAQKKKWKAENTDKSNIHSHNRRAKVARDANKLSVDLAERLLILQKGRCACCRCKLVKTGFHLDHIYPISRGGENSDVNIKLLCPTCNLRKHAKHPIEFMQSMGYLL